MQALATQIVLLSMTSVASARHILDSLFSRSIPSESERTICALAKMSKLFTPLKLGAVELGHRVAMAPLTRFRADDNRVPLPMVKGRSMPLFAR